MKELSSEDLERHNLENDDRFKSTLLGLIRELEKQEIIEGESEIVVIRPGSNRRVNPIWEICPHGNIRIIAPYSDPGNNYAYLRELRSHASIRGKISFVPGDPTDNKAYQNTIDLAVIRSPENILSADGENYWSEVIGTVFSKLSNDGLLYITTSGSAEEDVIARILNNEQYRLQARKLFRANQHPQTGDLTEERIILVERNITHPPTLPPELSFV